MEIEILKSEDQNKKSSMMLADAPKQKQLLVYDFLHKMGPKENKTDQSMEIFFRTRNKNI